MLSNILNGIVEKYKKTTMNLTEIEDENIKIQILNLLILIIHSDDEVDETEVRVLAEFMRGIFYSEKEAEELRDIIKNLFNSFDQSLQDNNISSKRLVPYINTSFVNICQNLSNELNNKQKDELLDIVIEVIHADDIVSDEETELLKLFRENILYNKIFGKKLKLSDDCPECRGGNVTKIGSKEVDRWVSPKEVQEQLASGKMKTRYVQTTYVRIEENYKCTDCACVFSTTYEKEK